MIWPSRKTRPVFVPERAPLGGLLTLVNVPRSRRLPSLIGGGHIKTYELSRGWAWLNRSPGKSTLTKLFVTSQSPKRAQFERLGGATFVIVRLRSGAYT
jgi:hypothetical protein